MSVRDILLLCAVVGGCDAPAPVVQEEKKADPKAAEEAKARLDERRKAREAEAKAAQEAEAKKTAAMDAACTAPADAPKKLQAACEAVSEAWDGFMQRKYKDEPEVLAKWNETKNSQLVFSMTQCKKQGSIPIAGCQANALRTVPVEIEVEAPELIAYCVDKCGGAAP